MLMRFHLVGAAALLLFLGVSPGRAQQTPPPPPSPAPATATAPAPTAPAPAAEATALSCGDCHEQAKAFTANAHAYGHVKGGVVPNDVCESCHGPGAAHIEAGGDKTMIYKPAGREGADKVCLKCHDTNTDRLARHAGMHANSAQINCLTCHSIHSPQAGSPHLLAKSEITLCNMCHMTQVASFRNKPFAHRIGRGGMSCSSCHEPHGRPSRDSLRMTTANESLPCYSCHSDKRGPFVFNHPPESVSDCTTCHEPHGSLNPKQLKRANVYQLCIECHSPIGTETFGSQPPSFHNLSLARYRNCTTCHVKVHGSNRDPQLFK
jgi:DmsE family decaheme c-type cytochrome